eukprot:15446169-Alexandrium_andersonii.AAC.1
MPMSSRCQNGGSREVARGHSKGVNGCAEAQQGSHAPTFAQFRATSEMHSPSGSCFLWLPHGRFLLGKRIGSGAFSQ